MGIIYAVLLLAAFVFAFIITDTCIKISSEPIAQTEVADSASEESTLS
jgi:hypothetical protein